MQFQWLTLMLKNLNCWTVNNNNNIIVEKLNE